jgi:hypothetical protein
MNRSALLSTVLWMLLSLFSFCFAEQSTGNKNISPEDNKYSNWVFSGMVKNEAGDEFGYSFQLQRENTHFQASARVIDAQSNQILLFEESTATIKNPDKFKWEVGRAFLTFNPINESWVFGVKVKQQKGFNFKVDMLNQQGSMVSAQQLRPGVALMVNQTGRINGHLHLGKDRKETFVTANNTWYRQVWLTKHQSERYPFSSLLCRFNDGSGLYSINMKREDAYHGAIAALCDAKGVTSPMSQFVDIQEDQHHSLKVHIPTPIMDFEITDSLNASNILAGFILKGAKHGFCVLSKDNLG